MSGSDCTCNAVPGVNWKFHTATCPQGQEPGREASRSTGGAVSRRCSCATGRASGHYAGCPDVGRKATPKITGHRLSDRLLDAVQAECPCGLPADECDVQEHP